MTSTFWKLQLLNRSLERFQGGLALWLPCLAQDLGAQTSVWWLSHQVASVVVAVFKMLPLLTLQVWIIRVSVLFAQAIAGTFSLFDNR